MSLNGATDGYFDALSKTMDKAVYANLVSILPKMIKSINIILLDALHYEKMKYVLYSIHHDGKLVGAYGYKVDGFPPLQYCDLE
ncbi:hypothetical protein BGZ59_000732 [Podila verticillata]|nr:hypothetical protein BGZ59_000732 [Podila verticillata]